MSQTSTQNTLLTASEGGIPPTVQHALHLIGADDQSRPSSHIDRDARISTVPLEESPAVPLPGQRTENPVWWPNLRRGMPDYREVQRNIRAEDRPLGQNTGEFVFLCFMFSGVGIVSAGNYVWRGTIGKMTDGIFKYQTGGQW
ncbi:hypothetical protein FFLO_05044 [Filobasidium floriforme]|uniref:Uncharacterized protein n=1 Tax=Filobasidium floriforme TaxID=5210 RepID=A0A8K0NNM5_9TREE|nr:uncharacterized protein HD553DRAFT_352909 [Filobasidium floriforme]KAG7530445.1 hypothetical protein FFLO_05044 [Filobasidium floriforme]KAH8078573.1 hypothetical protein HD553DRAFT_352909 [Filobasidium floriforme]